MWWTHFMDIGIPQTFQRWLGIEKKYSLIITFNGETLGPKYPSVYDCWGKFEIINKLVSRLLVCYVDHVGIQICRLVTNCNLSVPYWTWAPQRVIGWVVKSLACFGRLDVVNFIPFVVDLTYRLTLVKWHRSISHRPKTNQSTSRFILGLFVIFKDAFEYWCW